jgi:hypothetical protein
MIVPARALPQESPTLLAEASMSDSASRAA